jgi:hypothetical protein
LITTFVPELDLLTSNVMEVSCYAHVVPTFFYSVEGLAQIFQQFVSSPFITSEELYFTAGIKAHRICCERLG